MPNGCRWRVTVRQPFGSLMPNGCRGVSLRVLDHGCIGLRVRPGDQDCGRNESMSAFA